MDYITLKAGKYEAHISPDLGGNVIYFYDHEQKREILVGSHKEEEIKARPSCYGMPLLLPPNRIADGKFEYDGRSYQFPINEPARNNHLHGFFLLAEYQVLSQKEEEDNKEVVLEYIFGEADANFQYFPHKIRIRKTYDLSRQGLELTMTVENLSEQKIPMMFAFHTAFPLMGDVQKSSEMKVRLSVNGRVQLDDRLLGTDSFVSNDAIAGKAAEFGFSPVEEDLDNVYKMKKFGFRGAILTYPEYQANTVYEVDEIFHYFVVWNSGADGKIICIEPQTYCNNGINLPSWEKDGIHLNPGEGVTVKTKLSSEPYLGF